MEKSKPTTTYVSSAGAAVPVESAAPSPAARMRADLEADLREAFRLAVVKRREIKGTRSGFARPATIVRAMMPCLPVWFRRWLVRTDWPIGFICDGYDAFFRRAAAMGVSEEQCWAQIVDRVSAAPTAPDPTRSRLWPERVKAIYLFRDPCGKTWYRPVDDPPGGDGVLACLTQEDAEAMAIHQAEAYDIYPEIVAFSVNECTEKIVGTVEWREATGEFIIIYYQ